MSFKSYEELIEDLKIYNQFVCEIPEDFIVLDEHLNGMTKPEFIEAFRDYRNLVVNIYDDIIANPCDYGFGSIQKSGEIKPSSSQSKDCINKLLYSLGKASEIKGKSLHVDIGKLKNIYKAIFLNNSSVITNHFPEVGSAEFNKFYKSKHIDRLFCKLIGFGFSLDGFIKDKNYAELGYIILNHNKNENIPIVIKAFSDVKLSQISFTFDYSKFNYKVFSVRKNETLPFEDLYSSSLISDSQREVVAAIINEMAKIGAHYGECESGWYYGVMPCQYIFNNKIRIFQNANGVTVGILIKKIQPENFEKFMQGLPEKYHNPVICKKHNNSCPMRNAMLSGKINSVICIGGYLLLPCEMELFPYITQAYLLAK